VQFFVSGFFAYDEVDVSEAVCKPCTSRACWWCWPNHLFLH